MAACILVACSGDSVANKMYEHLEKSVELEQPFAEQQESFADLEEKEQEVIIKSLNFPQTRWTKLQT